MVAVAYLSPSLSVEERQRISSTFVRDSFEAVSSNGLTPTCLSRIDLCLRLLSEVSCMFRKEATQACLLSCQVPRPKAVSAAVALSVSATT